MEIVIAHIHWYLPLCPDRKSALRLPRRRIAARSEASCHALLSGLREIGLVLMEHRRRIVPPCPGTRSVGQARRPA